MKKTLLKICSLSLVVLTLVVIAPTAVAKAMYPSEGAGDEISVSNARAAMLLDYDTGSVIYKYNELNRQPIASMVKIMTLLLAFEHADSGLLDYDADVVISETASGMGGSQAFLDAGSSYKVNDLLQSIVVASANDSCVAIAEKISGSVETFVSEMNAKAAELKMENTRFVNCTGLPADGQYSCAADVATMSRELFSHKKFFEYSGVWMYDLTHPSGRVTTLTNTNKLIRAYKGCDGGKTGFTNEAMSCLSATAKRGDTRLISIVIGGADSKKRNAEVSKLLNYGFANYETKEVIKQGDKLSEHVKVEGGKVDSVEGAYADSFKLFAKKGGNLDCDISYEFGAVSAPIGENDIIGRAVISRDGNVIGEVNIVSCSGVEKKGYMDIVDDFISKW